MLKNYIWLSSKISDIYKVFGTKRGNGLVNTTILMVKKTIYKNRQKGREIKYLIYIQMKYEDHYAEIDQKTDKFLKNGELFNYTWIPYSLIEFVLSDLNVLLIKCNCMV